jgi:hypothetical protein
MKSIIIERHICFECGCDENIHDHHVVPKSKGGTKTIPLCSNCHSIVHGAPFLRNRTSKKKKPYYPPGSIEHKTLQMEGIKKAKENGKYTGRAFGTSDSIEHFMNKPKTKEIMSLLDKGLIYSDIQSKLKCSDNLIRKVKKYMDEHGKVLLPLC